MKTWKRFQITIAMIASCGILWPQAPVLAQSPAGASQIQDVELSADGVLQGRVVSAEGAPLPGAVVQLRNATQLVAYATADELGNFQVSALRGGNYTLAAGDQVTNLRVWTNQTAPPSARSGVLLVRGSITRAQGCTEDSCTGMCGGACGKGPLGFLLNPFVIGAAVAAAIAIPLALNNDNDNASG